MTPISEVTVCNYLVEVLRMHESGEPVEECEELDYALSVLEVTIPEILSEKYPFWKDESLDSLYQESALKISETEFEFFGMCALMSDQTLTPVYFRIRLGGAGEGFASAQIKLGEKSGKDMVKLSYDSDEWGDYLNGRAPEEIEWFYEAEI